MIDYTQQISPYIIISDMQEYKNFNSYDLLEHLEIEDDFFVIDPESFNTNSKFEGKNILIPNITTYVIYIEETDVISWSKMKEAKLTNEFKNTEEVKKVLEFLDKNKIEYEYNFGVLSYCN